MLLCKLSSRQTRQRTRNLYAIDFDTHKVNICCQCHYILNHIIVPFAFNFLVFCLIDFTYPQAIILRVMFLSRRKFAVGFILLFLFIFTFWEWKMFLTAFNWNVHAKIIKQTLCIFACRYCNRQFDSFEELKSAIENWHNNRTTVQIFRSYIYVYTTYGVKCQKWATFSLTKCNSKKRISTRV